MVSKGLTTKLKHRRVRVLAVLHREVSFRQRAQSADDEGSVELAESLQHLTLSEFLKEYVRGGATPSKRPLTDRQTNPNRTCL